MKLYGAQYLSSSDSVSIHIERSINTVSVAHRLGVTKSHHSLWLYDMTTVRVRHYCYYYYYYYFQNRFGTPSFICHYNRVFHNGVQEIPKCVFIRWVCTSLTIWFGLNRYIYYYYVFILSQHHIMVIGSMTWQYRSPIHNLYLHNARMYQSSSVSSYINSFFLGLYQSPSTFLYI